VEKTVPTNGGIVVPWNFELEKFAKGAEGCITLNASNWIVRSAAYSTKTKLETSLCLNLLSVIGNFS
jgi:hypothetical protein